MTSTTYSNWNVVHITKYDALALTWGPHACRENSGFIHAVKFRGDIVHVLTGDHHHPTVIHHLPVSDVESQDVLEILRKYPEDPR